MCALSVEDVSAGRKDWQPGSAQLRETRADSACEHSEFLDRALPLDGASHADVANYTIEIPMRYATCFAILKDGRKVKLKDKRKFLGWSGWNRKRSYLFRSDEQYIEIKTDSEQATAQGVPGNVCSIVLGSPVSEDQASANFLQILRQNARAITTRLNEDSKFIAPDGNQLVLSGGCLTVRELSHR